MRRVRTCGKQPIALQKATHPRSATAEGRVVKPDYNHGRRSRCTRGPPPLPKGAAKLTADGRWQMADGRRQTALRALKGQVRKATCRLSESDSSPLSIGGRQSREAGLQPRGAKSVNASLATAAKNRCQAHSRWRTALLAPKWQARMCRKQPNVGQKATLPRSASMEGRVVRFTGQTRHGNRRRRSSSPLPQGGGRSPGPLRQQSHSEGRRVRRPQRCRATSTSRPP
jgi:hypothetical protein